MYQHVFLLISLIAMIWDIKKHRIPNLLTYPAIFFNIVYQICKYSTNGIWYLFVNVLLIVVFFGHGYVSKKMGAGDIKILMALSFLFSPRESLFFIIMVVLFGGVEVLFIKYNEYSRFIKKENLDIR